MNMGRLSLALDAILGAYIAWQVVRFVPQYARLKKDIAEGDPRARIRVYGEALRFEWLSALLALLALGFDLTSLDPRSLALQDSPLVVPFSSRAAPGLIPGMVAGLALGTIGIVVARFKGRKSRPTLANQSPAARWRRVLPDFSALVPVTTEERLLWAGVAMSAGICEEVVFRGWLLSSLHGAAHLDGTALVAAGAALFGLAHAYQKIPGIILTGLAGIVFSVLYVATGSLLAPILLHIAVDLRFALLPRPREEAAAARA
jgi:membrane protease YdiL (CAAX protease family)